MDYTWRWFGPDDPVSLADIRQAGATGVVTALHHLPNDAVWPEAEIAERKGEIEAAGLSWQVVESIPVPETIKRGATRWQELADIWARSAINLAGQGVNTICYNFMPVLDWTRTALRHVRDDGAECLRFDRVDLAAFDMLILERAGAAADYDAATRAAAEARAAAMTATGREALTATVLAGLPGAEASYTLETFREQIAAYQGIDAAGLRANLAQFLARVVPQVAPAGVRLALHPDDPPRPLLGLPRVVSTAADLDAVAAMAGDVANGFTFCAGSLGVRADNDLPAMLIRHARRIHFLHLRNTRRDPVSALSDGIDGESFEEAAHLDGDTDMVALVRGVLAIEHRQGRRIPFRPDHGHAMLSDLGAGYRPGYPAIGRLRGMAEIRGVERALQGSAAG